MKGVFHFLDGDNLTFSGEERKRERASNNEVGRRRKGVSGKRLGEKDTTKAIYISKVIIWLELKARDDF